MSEQSTSGGETAHAALRGAIAAMAMTPARRFTVDLGIVQQTPPQAIVRQRAHGLIRRVRPVAGVRGFVLSEIRARPRS